MERTSITTTSEKANESNDETVFEQRKNSMIFIQLIFRIKQFAKFFLRYSASFLCIITFAKEVMLSSALVWEFFLRKNYSTDFHKIRWKSGT